eukprot:TRINITY_DN16642_c4_g1_i2.p1 TRINITY_DN16642_c4_g1~~TRINITY_DN16642_c4_g1_i2.p1  ORF type:complete len:216 (+),score=54.85 TRINITY_DN16642_c4_g1_i2:436-1083(+)
MPEEGRQISPIRQLSNGSRLVLLIAQRIGELSAAVQEAEEIGEGEGDPEVALLSALCLADSLLAVSDSNDDTDANSSLFRASLQALEGADKPEVLSAALEVLGTLLEASLTASSKDDQGSDSQKWSPKKDLEAFSSTSKGLTEKLALLLAEADSEETSLTTVIISLLLLQSAPKQEVLDHKEAIAPVACGLDTDQAIAAGLRIEFLQLFQGIRYE